jgi:hypothetical protein
VLVLVKVQFPASSQLVLNPAVGGVLVGGIGAMVMTVVFVLLRPSASRTVRLALKAPAVP